MQDWIKVLSEKERARLEQVKSFRAAIPHFVDKLIDQLQADGKHFQEEFPKHPGIEAGFYTLGFDLDEVRVKVENPQPMARLLFNAEERRLIVGFADTGDDHGYSAQFELLDGRIVARGLTQDVTIAGVSRIILIRLLFPKLTNDPNIKKLYLAY